MDETKIPATPVVQPPTIVSAAPSKERVGSVGVLEAAGPEIPPVVIPEVEQAGVKAVSEKPNITQQHVAAGINHSPIVQPVSTSPTGAVQLPSKEEVIKELKAEPKDNSRYGMLSLIFKTLKRIAIGK